MESSAPHLKCVVGEASILHDSDAFAQIVKELVDNAVDACCKASYGKTQIQKDDRNDNIKRVRVVIEPFEPSSNDRASSSAEDGTESRKALLDGTETEKSENNDREEAGAISEQSNIEQKETDNEAERHNSLVPNFELLRVTVSDNGCGMENIQDCVEAFRSSKADSKSNQQTNGGRSSSQSHTKENNPKQQEQQKQQCQEQLKTVGRYGIGLTLCLLHAQRLVPNSCASITSATVDATHFMKTQYVVDSEADSVRCVELSWIEKSCPGESGTSISMLVPVGLLIFLFVARN